MPGEAEEQGFTVVDRRGRRDAPEAPGEPVRAAASPGARPAPSGPTPASAEEPPLQVDLTALFLMLASSAVVHLGHAPDPLTGAPRRDLAQARLSIELLHLLREKTEGHRTPEESRLLEQILYDLQLQFVEAVEGSG